MRYKIVGNDFEQALLGPQGEGQDALNNVLNTHSFLKIAAPRSQWQLGIKNVTNYWLL